MSLTIDESVTMVTSSSLLSQGCQFYDQSARILIFQYNTRSYLLFLIMISLPWGLDSSLWHSYYWDLRPIIHLQLVSYKPSCMHEVFLLLILMY